MDHFSPAVVKEMKAPKKFYVYRLIDPRNGETFYVGKGTGNRVFAHAKEALTNYEGEDFSEEDDEEDKNPPKLQRIHEIQKEGLEVLPVIQRWGMDEETAYEVESALMDCFGSLTNQQAGHHSERGACSVQQLEKYLSRKEYIEPEDFEYIIIKIKQYWLDERGGDTYQTVRSAWKLSEPRVNEMVDGKPRYPYVLAVKDGIVIDVFRVKKWQKAAEKGRLEFDGACVKDSEPDIYNMFYDHRIPETYMKKGLASPALYSKNKEIK